MHYKNGREAKIGDKVLVQPTYGQPFLGILIAATPSSTSCNGTVVPMPNAGSLVTLSDCVHLDDVTIPAAAIPPTPTP